MACVFYEMFSSEDPDEDVYVREGNPNNEDDQDETRALLAPSPPEGNFLSEK